MTSDESANFLLEKTFSLRKCFLLERSIDSCRLLGYRGSFQHELGLTPHANTTLTLGGAAARIAVLHECWLTGPLILAVALFT